ncbi:MAG TPA: CotH kinase family protein [Dehalococcoidales bacterium]|nr:CotH kinase family protein [Dehalococcoidales bacterium]
MDGLNNRIRFPRKTLLALCGLLVCLCLVLSGCGNAYSGQADEKDAGPFYLNRVAQVKILMPAADWQNLVNNARAEQYIKADLWFDGQLVPDVAVRPKGNSSLMMAAASRTARLSLKVDLNFFNDARNLKGVKKLNFNNGFSDPTLIREALSYELFKKMGIPAPRYSFVDLWVNDVHLGVYTMVEQVDKAFLARHFKNNNGNLYKPEMPGGDLRWTEADILSQNKPSTDSSGIEDINLGGGKFSDILQLMEDASAPQPAVTPSPALPGRVPALQGGQFANPVMRVQKNLLESMGLKTNENSKNHKALLRFLEILNNEPIETFQREIEKVLDVDEALKYFAVSTVLVHLDNYNGQFAHNYYLYEMDGKFSILPWDLNMSFGGFTNDLDRQRIINFYVDEPTAGVTAARPLIARLLAVPAYLERYHGYLDQLITGPFSPAAMNDRIDAMANLIRPYVQNDRLKFFSTADFERGLKEDLAAVVRWPGMGSTIGLKVFVSQRNESIKNQLAGILPSKSTDGTGNGSRGMRIPLNQGLPGQGIQRPAGQ